MSTVDALRDAAATDLAAIGPLRGEGVRPRLQALCDHLVASGLTPDGYDPTVAQIE